jgi:cytochrome bd-type quinol oxidase subunit 2
MSYKNLIYSFACLSFAIIIGAAVYEHLAVVPQWAAHPPRSLSMFQGEYGLRAQNFWIPIHPVTLVLLIITLLLSWKTPRRINVLTTLLVYVAILAITAVYFVPELLEITGTPFSETDDKDLYDRAEMWEILSLIRLVVLIVLSIILFLGLTKNNTRPAEC